MNNPVNFSHLIGKTKKDPVSLGTGRCPEEKAAKRIADSLNVLDLNPHLFAYLFASYGPGVQVNLFKVMERMLIVWSNAYVSKQFLSSEHEEVCKESWNIMGCPSGLL